MTGEAELAIRLAPLPPLLSMPARLEAPEISIDGGVLDRLEEEAESMRHCEVGGLLVGHAAVAGSRLRLEVTGALPAESSDAGPGHLTFTHETWDLLRNRRIADHAGAMVVGWYHTHPGFGVFLSGLDRRLHARIFAVQPWCVALVLDPVNRHRGFFWPRGGEVRPCAETVRRRAGARAENEGGANGISDAENRQ
ncbi:MAG TPA: Mov34/MPN/PAD-1 family protein [Thermoanaerobaculia bacterium]|nr:Mov34/MPN/PAD-1 family protein [Thermoanaerobaculia bacterium]